MKVWIDLDNSPAALLFSPVARRLVELGHEVRVTARDNAQTVELGRASWPELGVFGGPSPPGRLPKVRTTVQRIAALRRWGAAERPDVALSHNSYAQIVAARALRVPVVTGMDYEHQPANHVAFRAAHIVLLPEAMRTVDVARLGATPRRTRFYPGLKEEIYLGDFEPDPAVLSQVGVTVQDGGALVVARTPPDRAIYHQFGNPLFTAALRAVATAAGTRTVVLARYPEQREAIRALGLAGVTVAQDAVDSRSLMHRADLVIGAGGTMTREAALLGAPTYSVYAGAASAVDAWLQRRGLLVVLRDPAELPTPQRRAAAALDMSRLRARGAALTEWFVEAVHDAGGRR